MIEFFTLPFLPDEGSNRWSGLGISIWGGSAYRHPLGGRARLHSGLDMSVVNYKGSPLDRITLLSHAGLRWLIDAESEASLLASAGKHWIAASSDSNVVGIRIEVRKCWG